LSKEEQEEKKLSWEEQEQKDMGGVAGTNEIKRKRRKKRR
jgi:hypothetical protein